MAWSDAPLIDELHLRKASWSLVLLIGLLVTSCGCSAARAQARGVSKLREKSHIDLSRPTKAESVLLSGGEIWILEGYPDERICIFTVANGTEKLCLEKSLRPGHVQEPIGSIERGPDGSVIVVDRMAYRVTQFSAPSATLVSSFLVSGYDYQPLGAVSDPARRRIAVFSSNAPEVRMYNIDGLPMSDYDSFDEDLTDFYAGFRGAFTRHGSLVYTPIASYDLHRISPDGAVHPFTSARGGGYVAPQPLPEWSQEDADSAKRYDWEKTVSWVVGVASCKDSVVVAYSVPPGLFDNIRIDVFHEDGSPISLAIPAPGRLVGCQEDGSCWFLTSDHRRLIRSELPQ